MVRMQEVQERVEEAEGRLETEGATSWVEAEHEPAVSIIYYTPDEVPSLDGA